MENKEKIVKLLKMLLMATRAGSNIEDLILNENQDEVTITFKKGGENRVNIACDSGLGIIKDVVAKIS